MAFFGAIPSASASTTRSVDACDTQQAPHSGRCHPTRIDNGQAKAKGHPAIEASGTVPSIDTMVPLLRPGTFRIDVGSFVETFGVFGPRYPNATTTLQESLTIGYGVSDRFTIFGGAVEANAVQNDGRFVANFVDPKVGFVYRLLQAPQFQGFALDFVGEVAVNDALSSPPSTFGPYGDLGPIFKTRLLATRELGHGVTVQLSGGFFGASVTMPFPGPGSHTNVDVGLLLGVTGQYRLSPISDRLYVSGELDLMRPLTRNAGQQLFASPFQTTEMYAGTGGLSYVIKPGFIVARLTDIVALNVGQNSSGFATQVRHNTVSNTTGLTISFMNLTPHM